MCGFTGFLEAPTSALTSDAALAALHAMNARLALRGPDSADVWLDPSAGVGLGHRRLAVVDLSPAGAQPMHSATGKYVLAFNGEVYNHLDLRRELHEAGKQIAFRGHSDTETLLAGFEAWGIVDTLKRAVGMFAFAAWDTDAQLLTLARDRFGEKPLYYGFQGATFLFGSELSALRAHPEFRANIDRRALCLYLQRSYVPAPYSIYAGISKLEPGSVFTLSTAHRVSSIRRYWHASDAAMHAKRNPFAGTTAQAVDQLETLVSASVRQQMVADVPLGAFLSGGVDSSTVVALMQQASTRPVKTFTVGFEDDSYNEAEHAKAVARHLGTEHTELYVSADDAMQVIPRLPRVYSEPFADPSQIPTLIVCELARKHVTVALSGDGGDELFAGYNRYQLTEQLWRKLQPIPAAVRTVAARAIRAVPPAQWDAVVKHVPMFANHPAMARFGDKLHKGARVLASKTSSTLYQGLVAYMDEPAAWVKHVPRDLDLAGELSKNISVLGASDAERMMVLDSVSYLPDDILCKVDRAGMGVSLEARIPFLDHRIYEFAWQLPMHMKLHDGQTKWVLREVLYRHVPRALIERPKLGFGIPLDAWLRGPLKDWADALLNTERIEREGFFHAAPVAELWRAHQAGRHNHGYQLWTLLMFQAWLEENPVG
jgi:asparagine synthase (glutamine-hydrolysing)